MQKIMFEHRRFGLEQAVIARQKEMTRRKVCFPKDIRDKNMENAVRCIDKKGRVYFTFYNAKTFVDIYPRYQIGERVALAQSYEECWNYYQKQWEARNNPSDWQTPDTILGDSVQETPGWTNKMFVRADLMPHVIEITDIKAERLQDISDEDCLREGLLAGKQEPKMYGFRLPKGTVLSFMTPREAFAALIDRINGRGTWQRNEWQFAYTFKLER